jgi:hypothetical protein
MKNSQQPILDPNASISYSKETLTKLEHFAGLAMQVFCKDYNGQAMRAEFIAKNSVAIAKALLTELEKENQTA